MSETRRFPDRLVEDIVGSGSHILGGLLPVIYDLRICVSMTKDMLRQSGGALPHPSYLSDARKWTQHQLVSLSTFADLEIAATEPVQHLRLYEVVRLCLHIFSLLAVYPLPIAVAPFPALAAALASQIKLHQESALAQSTQNLSLWLSTMGAIAAFGRQERNIFIDVVKTTCQGEEIKSWPEFRSILEGYLWYPEVSDFDGRIVWIEVERQIALESA